MKYRVFAITLLLLAGMTYTMRDTIFPSDTTSVDDEPDEQNRDPCSESLTLEEMIEISEKSPNSIPNPKEEVAYIESFDGTGFDYNEDRYLYRWRVAETYNSSNYEFEQNFTDYRNPFMDYQQHDLGNPNNQRHLKISEQYLTKSDWFCGEALVPWNSQFGGLIGPISNVNAKVSNIGSYITNSTSGYRDINEQPILRTQFDTTLTQGILEYESYWVEENKQTISSKSISMDKLHGKLNGSYSNNYPISRFGNLSSVNSLEMRGIWGVDSLPEGVNYVDPTNPAAAEFVSKYNDYASVLAANRNISVYDFILLVYNDIQNAVINGLYDGRLNIDPTQTSNVADPGSDKAFWFYRSLEDPSMQISMKELLAGFTNMLRSFGIPARPIIGFSVGEFYNDQGTPGIDPSAIRDDSKCFSDDCDYIKLKFEHIHVWIEALIPVEAEGITNYHWGIFNPVPDPWILQNDNEDWEYGRNALGGRPNIEFEITTGNPTVLPSPIGFDGFPTLDTLLVNEMGEDLTGRVRISYDGVPKIRQTVSLRIVNETELLSGYISPEMGIELLSVVTTDANGWGNFKIYVDRTGKVFTYNSLNVINPIPISNLLIDQLSPLQNVGNMGLYGIIVVYNMQFNGSLTGWDLNFNLNLNVNVTPTVMINPNNGQTIMPYVAEFERTLEFSVAVTDDSSNVLEGIENIEFLLMKENDYDTFINSLQQQVLDVSLVSANSIGLFSITNNSGIGTINITFNQTLIDLYSILANEIYVAVALIQNGLNYNPDPVFVWFTL